MHRYELAVLKALQSGEMLSLEELVVRSVLGKDAVLWAIENLSGCGAIESRRESHDEAVLTEEGARYAKGSLPESDMISRAQLEPIAVQSLKDNESRIGLQWAKMQELITIDKGMITITAKGRAAIKSGIPEEQVLKRLLKDSGAVASLLKSNKVQIENLSRRRLIVISSKSAIGGLKITAKGMEMLGGSPKAEEIEALDRKMLSTGSWAGKKFKKYDISVAVEREAAAKKHPLRGMIERMRDVHIAMGFKEFSGPTVIPAFWNFDTLFTPQDHPAREAQDTFYVSHPSSLALGPAGLVSQVKTAHETAWHDDWLAKVAMQAVLRTHTTSLSVQQLYNLARYKDYKMPLKLFTIGKVFRNENVDYKHLLDFYQADGIIVGENLTMANLFDTLIKLYKSLGMKVRFKPAYFPFVEPGAEVQAFYEPRKEWLEVGGTGILRREITGITKKSVTVLAWGLALERPLMIKDDSIQRLTDMYNGGIGWLRQRRLQKW
ncbi:MAG: phenylalanine--tRNA ligase subunit alpha [Candidatus Micrarchaeota archaeon]|nr:phenylalanine--tRNA ligase subunit alpha [Candidatus Micrarchaeota archaeon]MDE1848251.1 phenylalanine--tRNA ligase subunit alpha [Candidatus Micrarchaeota archaeon]MDE1864395.1 phenylalanine--tRNA ligase subunit alpha [Candidatus Micrarchaeota archaeon]